MVLYSEIVNRLIQYRNSIGKSQTEFAKFFPVSQCQLSKIESYEYRISFDALVNLHTYAGLDIDFLITGKANTHTIFHSLENTLTSSSSAARYKYVSLIIFALNNYLFQYQKEYCSFEHSLHICRLLKFSSLSEHTKPTDYWVNLRKAFNLSQIKMAAIVDIDIKRYRNIEKNIKTANAELLMNVYNNLKIPPSYFLHGRIESYEELNQVFLSFPETVRKEIICFLENGIQFINQTKKIY